MRCKKIFAGEEHIRNWLIRVTINECKKLLASPFKNRTIPLEDIPEQVIFDKQEESDLYYAVMSLGANYRSPGEVYMIIRDKIGEGDYSLKILDKENLAGYGNFHVDFTPEDQEKGYTVYYCRGEN